MLSAAIEVESPCTPTSSGGRRGSVAEIADVLMYSVSTRSQCWGKGAAYDRKDILLILCNAHRANGVREFVHELSGMGSKIDLPDLGSVDQCHENLAVRANSDVLNPLNGLQSAIAVPKLTMNCDKNIQCHSRNGESSGRDYLHRVSSQEKRYYGKRRGQTRMYKSESRTSWDDRNNSKVS